MKDKPKERQSGESDRVVTDIKIKEVAGDESRGETKIKWQMDREGERRGENGCLSAHPLRATVGKELGENS